MSERRRKVGECGPKQATAEWAEGIARFEEESGGLLAIVVISPEDAPALFEAARAGDPDAVRLAHAVTALVERVNDAEGALCASCDANLADTAFSAVIATPACDDPALGIGLGVCIECATEHDAIVLKAGEGLRRAFPSLRHITLQGHGAGRA
jgi:hypothetical protein